jgi:hypothetical protein
MGQKAETVSCSTGIHTSDDFPSDQDFENLNDIDQIRSINQSRVFVFYVEYFVTLIFNFTIAIFFVAVVITLLFVAVMTALRFRFLCIYCRIFKEPQLIVVVLAASFQLRTCSLLHSTVYKLVFHLKVTLILTS